MDYQNTSRYDRKGFGKGIWKYRLEGKTAKRQIYSKDGRYYTTHFYPDGSIELKGQPQLTVTEKKQWIYNGD